MMNLKFVLPIIFASVALVPITALSKPSSDRVLNVAGGELSIHLKAETKISENIQIRWLEKAAEAVSHYYGKFPVKKVTIDVINEKLSGHIGGTTWDGRLIEMRLGKDVAEKDLQEDWTATHEMFHLAFPQIGDDYVWMGEGLATYLEPFARTRRKLMNADQAWRELYLGLDNGAPKRGDKGLDFTHTWGRTYWGGAGFWFQADLQIRQKTKNKKSLDNAVRAVLDQGGDGSVTWSLAKLFTVANQATGLSVISDLHEKMGLKPGWSDFDQIWKQLGVSLKKENVIYDDKAPLAEVRKSMSAPD